MRPGIYDITGPRGAYEVHVRRIVQGRTRRYFIGHYRTKPEAEAAIERCKKFDDEGHIQIKGKQVRLTAEHQYDEHLRLFEECVDQARHEVGELEDFLGLNEEMYIPSAAQVRAFNSIIEDLRSLLEEAEQACPRMQAPSEGGD